MSVLSKLSCASEISVQLVFLNKQASKSCHKFIFVVGTTAKVSMIFSGDEDETPPRLIFDDKKPVLQRGGIDSFIMAVPLPLGSLNVVR